MRTHSLVAASALALLLAAPSASVATVQQGDPLVWFMSDRHTNRACGDYALVAEQANITGLSSCGSGFAVGVAGTSIAPPHVFTGEGLNRIVEVGQSGHAHMVFDILVNPGVFEVQVTVKANDVAMLVGKQLCNVSAPCDVALTGDGGSARFEHLIAQIDFPTIVGGFTPFVVFGGSDPSLVEADGQWGQDYPPATAPIDVLAPLANLTTDGVLFLGQGTSGRCLAMAFAPLPASYCMVGQEDLFGTHFVGEHWVAPRGMNASGNAVLRLGLAPYLTDTEPTAGAIDFSVTLMVMGRPALHGTAHCAWDALPTSCEIPLTGKAITIPWKGIMFLDVTATTDSQAVRVAAGSDPGSLTFNGWTWDPDPTPAPAVVPAPALGIPLLAAVLLALAMRRR